MVVKEFVVICMLVTMVWGEVITVEKCGDTPLCNVDEVRITPCPQKKKCRLKKQSTASISFDFTPNFTASKLKTTVSYTGIAFASLDADACKYTTCPTEPGKTQQYNYDLTLGKSIPTGTFPVVWKVWNDEDTSQLCCFKTTLKIVK